VDLVPRALVVDQRARAELVDREEPRPLDVVAVALPAARPAPRHVRRQRQAWERVPREEALGGEVAVGVEVGLADLRVLVAQQHQLALRVRPPPLGRVPVSRRGPRVQHNPLLLLGLLQRRAVERPPAPERRVQSQGCRLHLFGDPFARPPRHSVATGLPRLTQLGEHSFGSFGRPAAGAAVGQPPPEFGQDRQFGVGRVDDVGQLRPHRLVRLGEPDRVHVAPDEVLVAEVQARRRHGAGHHVPRVAEPVGVVGVAGGAVGDHERRLAGAAGPAGALRVVGRRGRDVA